MPQAGVDSRWKGGQNPPVARAGNTARAFDGAGYRPYFFISDTGSSRQVFFETYYQMNLGFSREYSLPLEELCSTPLLQQQHVHLCDQTLLESGIERHSSARQDIRRGSSARARRQEAGSLSGLEVRHRLQQVR